MTTHPVLIGQYDSPFVRRVAVALHPYGVAFERHILSTFTDFETMLELDPLALKYTRRPCDLDYAPRPRSDSESEAVQSHNRGYQVQAKP